MNALFLFLALLRPFCRLRREHDFEVIDAHFGHPSGVAAALLAAWFRRPFVVTLRGDETMHAQHRLRRAFLRWSLRRASRVITVSERLREFAISLGADKTRVKTIPNGIDARIFHARDRRDCRARHGIPPDAAVVLSAGPLIERKGHHRTMRALRALALRGRSAQLLIAGSAGREGRFEAELRRLCSELQMDSSVRFMGQVSPVELAELMSAADVFCLATTREGWPNVIHEAMGCGAPVVVSDVGAVPDMVPSDRYGFVVPVNDQPALENALERALSKSWDRAAIEAWAQARQWEQVAREMTAEIGHALACP